MKPELASTLPSSDRSPIAHTCSCRAWLGWGSTRTANSSMMPPLESALVLLHVVLCDLLHDKSHVIHCDVVAAVPVVCMVVAGGLAFSVCRFRCFVPAARRARFLLVVMGRP